MPLKVLDVRFKGMLRQVVEGKKFVRRIINSMERQTDKQHGGESEENLGPQDQAQTCQGL